MKIFLNNIQGFALPFIVIFFVTLIFESKLRRLRSWNQRPEISIPCAMAILLCIPICIYFMQVGGITLEKSILWSTTYVLITSTGWLWYWQKRE